MTILPVIPVFNQQAKDRAPPLPIKVDGLLMHIAFALGSGAAEELGAIIDAMINTGAGCFIGNLDFFLSLATLHPSIVMQVFESKDGDYSPILMTGIVVDGAGPSASTWLWCVASGVFFVPEWNCDRKAR